MKQIIYYLCIIPFAILLIPILVLLYIIDRIVEKDYSIRLGNYIDKKLQPFKSWAFDG